MAATRSSHRWLGPSASDLSRLAHWPARRWVVAVLAGALAALLIGVPTGVVESGLFTRMTPVTWWNYPIWALSAALAGLTAATYVRAPGWEQSAPDRTGRTMGATLLSAFAVGCPVCNKLIVALIGVGGALSYWAPLQPVLGVLSVGLLGAGLIVRLRTSAACAAVPGMSPDHA